MKRIALALIVVGMGSLVVLATAAPVGRTERKDLNEPGRRDNMPFTHAILSGNTLYISGKIGLDPKTGKAPKDVEKEIRLAMDGVKKRVELAGLTMDDLVSVQIFCSDLALYDQFNAVYRTYFRKRFPVRAFIGSGPILRGGRFEISAIAVR